MPYGPADAVDPGTLKRALVIKLRHHGDVLLASPVFSVLKNRAPQVEIDALVYADTRDMLSLHPAIAQVHVVERGWKTAGPLAWLLGESGLLRQLRARRYDLLIHLSEHPRGAWLARALGPRVAVAPDHPNKPRFWKRSFTHRYALPKNARRHMVELNLDALRRIGIQPGDDERALVLVPGTEAERSVEATLARHGLTARGYVLFHPGSRWQFKCWPAEKAAALLDDLQRRGERVVISAAPGQSSSSASIPLPCTSPPPCKRRWWRFSVRAASSNGGPGGCRIASSPPASTRAVPAATTAAEAAR